MDKSTWEFKIANYFFVLNRKVVKKNDQSLKHYLKALAHSRHEKTRNFGNFSDFSLLQSKYILFVGENTAGTDDTKMRQAIRNKNQARPSRQEQVFR